MGNPGVHPDIANLIITAWFDLRDAEGPDVTASRVLEEAETKLKSGQRTDSKTWVDKKLPELRATQKIIKETRERYEALGRKNRAEDVPWSLATLDRYPIPPESLPFVLNTWRNCVPVRLPFTIRLVKWMARLHMACPDRDTARMYSLAHTYAHAERESLMAGKDCFDSSYLDARAVMSDAEAELAVRYGAIVKPDYQVGTAGRVLRELTGLAKEEQKYALTDWIDFLFGGGIPGEIAEFRMLGPVARHLPALNLREDAARVYAHLLLSHAKNKGWKLSDGKAAQFAAILFVLVLREGLLRVVEAYGDPPEGSNGLPSHAFYDLGKWMEAVKPQPDEIFKTLGLTEDTEIDEEFVSKAAAVLREMPPASCTLPPLEEEEEP